MLQAAVLENLILYMAWPEEASYSSTASLVNAGAPKIARRIRPHMIHAISTVFFESLAKAPAVAANTTADISPSLAGTLVTHALAAIHLLGNLQKVHVSLPFLHVYLTRIAMQEGRRDVNPEWLTGSVGFQAVVCWNLLVQASSADVMRDVTSARAAELASFIRVCQQVWLIGLARFTDMALVTCGVDIGGADGTSKYGRLQQLLINGPHPRTGSSKASSSVTAPSPSPSAPAATMPPGMSAFPASSSPSAAAASLSSSAAAISTAAGSSSSSAAATPPSSAGATTPPGMSSSSTTGASTSHTATPGALPVSMQERDESALARVSLLGIAPTFELREHLRAAVSLAVSDLSSRLSDALAITEPSTDNKIELGYFQEVSLTSARRPSCSDISWSCGEMREFADDVVAFGFGRLGRDDTLWKNDHLLWRAPLAGTSPPHLLPKRHYASCSPLNSPEWDAQCRALSLQMPKFDAAALRSLCFARAFLQPPPPPSEALWTLCGSWNEFLVWMKSLSSSCPTPSAWPPREYVVMQSDSVDTSSGLSANMQLTRSRDAQEETRRHMLQFIVQLLPQQCRAPIAMPSSWSTANDQEQDGGLCSALWLRVPATSIVVAELKCSPVAKIWRAIKFDAGAAIAANIRKHVGWPTSGQPTAAVIDRCNGLLRAAVFSQRGPLLQGDVFWRLETVPALLDLADDILTKTNAPVDGRLFA